MSHEAAAAMREGAGTTSGGGSISVYLSISGGGHATHANMFTILLERRRPQSLCDIAYLQHLTVPALAAAAAVIHH